MIRWLSLVLPALMNYAGRVYHFYGLHVDLRASPWVAKNPCQKFGKKMSFTPETPDGRTDLVVYVVEGRATLLSMNVGNLRRQKGGKIGQILLHI